MTWKPRVNSSPSFTVGAVKYVYSPVTKSNTSDPLIRNLGNSDVAREEFRLPWPMSFFLIRAAGMDGETALQSHPA